MQLTTLNKPLLNKIRCGSLLCLGILVTLSLFAQKTRVNQGNTYVLNKVELRTKDQVLEENLKVYIDKAGTDTFKEIRNKETLFEENKTRYAADYSTSTFWVKLALIGDSQQSAEYLIDCAAKQHRWKRITAYLLHEDNQIDTIQSGSSFSKEEKSIPSDINLLPIKIEKGEQVNLYLRLEGAEEKFPTRRNPLAIQLTLVAKQNHPGYFKDYPFQGIFYDTQTVFPFTGNELFNQEFYVEREDNNTTINQIISGWEQLELTNKFTTLHTVDKVYWMKTRFYGSPHFNGNQILHIAPSIGMDNFSFDYVDIYTVNKAGQYSHQRTGDQVPLSERPYDFWANFIKLELSPTDTVDLFVRMSGADWHYLMPSIGLFHIDEASVFPKQSKEALNAGLFYGIIAIQCIFFLILFIIERERIHLYFTLMGLGILLGLVFNTISFKSYVLFPTWRNYHLFLFALGVFLSQFGFLKFTATYFNYAKDSFFRKWFITIFSIVFGLLLINLIAQFQLISPAGQPYKRATYYLPVILGTLSSITIGLWMAFRAPVQKAVSKKSFFIAFLPLVLIMTFFLGIEIIISLNILDFSILKNLNLFFTVWDGIKLSVLAMLTLLALSIGFRNNQLKKEKEFHRAQKNYLEELDKTKTIFFTNISHEFRTPLTIISGMAAQIKDNPKEVLDNGLEMIQRNSDQLLNLVNQLLDLGKLEGGQLKLNYQQGDIISYLKYLIESAHSLAANKQIVVHFHAAKELILMDFDEEKIRQILINLLSNAIKFTPHNGHIYVSISTVKTNKQATEFPNNETLKIVIRDMGSGIPADQLPFIFDRFYQVDGTSTRQGEGSGIGLALVKELLTLMHGTISVKSKLQKETTFTLLLPITNEAPEFKKAITPVPISDSKNKQENRKKLPKLNEATTIEQSKQSVLIIEDNADVVAYIVTCLQPHFEVQIANDGAEGIKMAIENIPDIVITDVMMPIKDGFEVCHTLKKDIRTSHIPIIMLTAKTDIESKLHGLEKGADAYLTKPFHTHELLIHLEQLIAKRKHLQAIYSNLELIVEPAPKTEDVFLQKIQQAILDNLEQGGFGPNELATALGTSRTQLHRKLKALTNISTSKYINKIKLQEAKRLLSSTKMNISEVAYTLGYTSLNYFSNSFSKEFGLSPRGFREQEAGKG